MNEEQNQQNIPAPVSLENNNQNIAQNKGLQIKSWHILLFGTIVQFLIVGLNFFRGMFLFSSFIFFVTPSENSLVYGFAIVIYYIISCLVSFILVFFLYFINTRKTGSIFCIALGLVEIVIGLILTVIPYAGFFSLIAGFYYFWKKN